MTTFLPTGPADTAKRPGWGELVAGLVIAAIIVYRVPPLLAPHAGAFGPVLYGLILAAIPGVAALSGFTAAARSRIRSLGSFGLYRVPARWIACGAGAGLAAITLTAVTAAAVLPAATTSPVDGVFAGGGPVATALSVLVLAVLVPLGQELLFRGVVATVLLRHGAVVGVLGSTLLFATAFALVHGATVPVIVSAAVLGLVTGELRRRSGSIWPGLAAHVVHNLVALALVLIVTGAP